MLQLRQSQMEAFAIAKLQRSRRRIVEYLRSVADQYVAHLDDEQMLEIVERYERIGVSLNLKSERAQAQWAFLMVTTGGAASEPGPIRDLLLACSSSSSDNALSAIMGNMEQLEANPRRTP